MKRLPTIVAAAGIRFFNDIKLLIKAILNIRVAHKIQRAASVVVPLYV
jgi:hypothetical protein